MISVLPLRIRCKFARSVTVFSAQPRQRLRPWIAAACLLGLLAAPGCDDDSDTEGAIEKPVASAQSGELVSLSFEAVAYVETTANNITVLDRVRNELKSAFSALQARQITISQKRQVDVDLKRLAREPITVVDPVTHAVRPAVRVRYRFVGLAVVPKEVAVRGDMVLGLLHRDDSARAAEVIAACTSPASRTGDAVKQPWRIFDPGLDACFRAIDAEQAKIDEARVGLEHPDREIVTAELERLYLPVVLHVKMRAAPGANAEGSAHGGPAGAASAHEAAPTGSGNPVVGAAASAIDPAALLAAHREERLLAKLKASERAADDDADEREVAEIMSRPNAGGLRSGAGGPKTPFLGYGGETQPLNFSLLWFASIAVIVLLGTEIRRRFLRGNTRRPRR